MKECIRYPILILMNCLLISMVAGQRNQLAQIESIKVDPDYIWGEAEGMDRESVRSTADTDLLSKIQISIFVIDSLISEATSTTYKEKYSSLVTSFTNLHLKGLRRIEYTKKRWLSSADADWIILSYIHHDSVAHSMNLRQMKLRGLIAAGLRAADGGRVGEALRNLYWGYLLSQTSPDTIMLNDKKSIYPQVDVPYMINSILDDLLIEAEDSYIDGDAVIAPLEFTFRGSQVNEGYFSYYSGMGTEYAFVNRGYADVPIYDQPVSSTRKLTLAIEYKYISEMPADKEITALHNIFGESTTVDNLKSVVLRFPWLMEEKEEPPPIPEPSTEAIEVLNARRADLEIFLDLLNQYKKLNFLLFGKRNDFDGGADCYVAVVGENSVEDILFYDGRLFISINTHKSFSDLSEHFQGKRAIWIKETG